MFGFDIFDESPEGKKVLLSVSAFRTRSPRGKRRLRGCNLTHTHTHMMRLQRVTHEHVLSVVKVSSSKERNFLSIRSPKL